MDADPGTVAAGETRRHRDAAGAAAVFLLGVGTAWAAGNVGPVVAELGSEFEISLPSVGVLSGTLFYAAMVLALVLAPFAAGRLGLTRALIVGCLLAGLGNLLFALAPGYGALAAGRVLAGAGLGFTAGLGPVFARATGGVRRVGLFGASFQLGIAGGLGLGSALFDLDVDWRIGFLLSAVVAVSAIPFLARERVGAERSERRPGFLGIAVRSPHVWRLQLLFAAMFAVPLTLGAWFVHYTAIEGGLSVSLAGGLAFVLFGVSALMREIGGALAGRGVSPVLLAGVAPWLAAAGLAAIAVDRSAGVVAVAAVVMGLGFALPYATMMIEAQRLFPPEPAQPTSMLSMAATALAIAVIPVLGVLLDDDLGEEGFLALGAFVLVAGLFNLRPADRPLVAEEP